MSGSELSADERDEALATLADLRRAEAEQTARLRPLCAQSDRDGIERLPWPVLIEMAARAEILRRLHEQIRAGCEALGIAYDPNAAATN